jgi:hypothetical protein
MGYINKSSIFKFESFNTAHQKKAFQSIIDEKKDVFVNLTTDAGNHFIFITPLVNEAIRCNIRIEIFKQIVNIVSI